MTTTLATVTEAQADAATAAIFADIRDTMGVALVNLIWRHLAVSPAALAWSWHSLKPLYASGAVPRAAWVLRQTLTLPALDAFSAAERSTLAENVDDPGLVDAVLRTYERGNAQNLVALCALRERLAGRARPAGTAADREPARHGRHDSDEKDHAAERADRVTETLPPLPAMAELGATVRADVEALAAIWVPERHRGLIPSVFRHLAHWPALLTLYRSKLQAMPATPGVTELARRAIEAANTHALPLAAQTGAGAAPDAQTGAWLRGALDLFIDGMIGPGVVIVPAMRKVLPLR